MTFNERAKDSLIKNQQKSDTKQVAGLINILRELENLTLTPEPDVEKDICPQDGCLLFQSDPSCPACKLELLNRSKNGRHDLQGP